MRILYSFGIRCYVLIIRLAALFGNGKAKLWINGRKNQKHTPFSASNDINWIWVHASSLGEFEQGRPLIEAFKEHFTEVKILLTFFSPSGYEIRKNFNLADRVLYLPADLPSNANEFLNLYNPVAAFFIKYDFWFNFLAELNKRKVPVFLVSGIFRPSQHFFKWYGHWQRKQLKAFNHFFLQDEHSKKLLEDIGFRNCSVSGDTRFDRVVKLPQEQRDLPLLKSFISDARVFMAGSSWEADEVHIINFMKNCPQDIKFIIVPHEVHPERISSLINQLPLAAVRYSELGTANFTQCRVLVVDTIGLLGYLYRFASMVLIGNGFGSGIHNILEPAVYGKPIVFGPNYSKFREARELINIGGAFTFETSEEFAILCDKILNDNELYNQMTSTCIDYVFANAGATDHIINHSSIKGLNLILKY